MEKITIKQLKELKEVKYGKVVRSNDSMKNWVINDILSEEDILEYIQGVLNHGCISGFVSSLVYYNQTEKFFDNFSGEILELIEDYRKETENMDWLEFNKNSLAWFGYEGVIREIADELGLEL